jgi:hypothetical protein
MKIIILAVLIFVAFLAAAAEPPAQDPAIEILKLQIVNVEKDMRNFELSYELAKQQRERLLIELGNKMAATGKAAEKK